MTLATEVWAEYIETPEGQAHWERMKAKFRFWPAGFALGIKK